MKNHKLKVIIGSVCLLLIGVCGLIFTTPGSKIVTDKIISGYAAHEELFYGDLEGSLGTGMTLKDLEIRGIKNLPEGTTLKIQKLFFNITSFSLKGVTLEAENMRLMLPDSDPVFLSGSFKQLQLDFNIYSKGFTVTEILTYLPDLKKLIPLKGEVSDIDLFITGYYLEPVLKGSFIIDKFVYEGFVLKNAPLNIDTRLEDIQGDVGVYGTVRFEEGELQTQRASVKLERSDLIFSGPWDQPQINLRGNSKVEKTKISIILKGTVEKPELILASEPSYPQEKLMIMLATGKSWQSIDDAADGGLNPSALTKDFVDYFFFAGRSNQFARRFGISDFSVQYDQDRRGIAARKELSDKLEVGYGISRTKTDEQAAEVSQKLEGEYKVSDSVSVGVEREIKNQQPNELLDEQINKNNDKVFIQYKKSF